MNRHHSWLQYCFIVFLSTLSGFAFSEVEEDECGKFSYSSSLKQAHIYETIPSNAYLGYTSAEGGYRNGYRLAFCEMKNDSPKLTYLHFTKSDGSKGGEISVNNSGELDWSLSLCGSNGNNTLGGGWAYRADHGWLNQHSCGNYNIFDQVTLLPNRWLKIYTLGGKDSVKGVINQIHNEDSINWQLLVRGGSGNDTIVSGDYEYSYPTHTLKSVPAFAKIEGDSGDDDITYATMTWFGDAARDYCLGGPGDDWIRCEREFASCNGGSGSGDLCVCENEQLCEINP